MLADAAMLRGCCYYAYYMSLIRLRDTLAD